MEEDESKIPKLRIADEDFIMEEISPGSRFYNLVFMKKTKKRGSGEITVEPGKPLYGVSFLNCIKYIYKHKTRKKFQDRNIKLREFLIEYKKVQKQLYSLLDSHLSTGKHYNG